MDTRGGNAGTIGTTLDLAVQMMLEPQHVPTIARTSRVLQEEERQSLLAVLGEAARSSRAGDTPALVRACSALALGVEAYRTAKVMPGSPLQVLGYALFDLTDRYGTLWVQPLVGVLSAAAGRRVDLAVERAALGRLLGIS